MPGLKDQLQATLGNNYTLERELGGGGMSRVFVAEEVALERKVVVKVLQPDLAATVNLERFRREIQLAAKLQHPHIVPVLTAGVSDGLPFYTMPFIEGQSLRARLGRTGELPVQEVARILRDVLSALSYAHTHNVVHRDIKPDNVLLTGHHAVVTDFGVAKALSAATNPGSSLTSLGVALGTPAYMSPEQAAADVNTDHRADIYAVGAMAYEMLTGQQVFSARSPQAMLAAHAMEKPEPVDVRRPSVPPMLSALVMRALEKHAADRPQSADEMLADLEAAVTPSGATPQTGFTPARRRSVWPRRAILASGVAAVVVLGFFGFRSYAETRSLDSNRVLVGPFQNRTGDAGLDNLSTMASDWIARGLSETALADVVSFSASRDAAGKIVPAEFEASSLRSRARSLSARRIVFGSFHRYGDSVEFQAKILDASDGSLIESVVPVRAHKAEAMKGVDGVRSRVMAALASITRSELIGIDAMDAPPSYAAYKEFARGNETFENRDFRTAIGYFKRAAAIDTTYLVPLVLVAYSYENLNDCAGTDSIGKMLLPRRDQLSAYQNSYLDRVIAWCHGDWNSAYVAAQRMAAIAPKASFSKYVSARSAIPINRPREAVEGLERMDWRSSHTLNYYTDLSFALHKLGDYKHQLEVARLCRARFPGSLEPLRISAAALSALGRPDEAIKTVNESLAMASRESVTPADVMLAASGELAAHGHPKEALDVGNTLLAWARQRSATEVPASLLTVVLLRAGKYTEARALARRMIDENPRNLTTLTLDGITAARVGDTAAALRASAAIGALQVPYIRGDNFFRRAKIAALLGQKDQAVAFLREAFRQGMSYFNIDDADSELLPLHGYPPYEELLRPKG